MSNSRLQRSVTFVSDPPIPQVRMYIRQLIRDFESETKKPTQGQLKNIRIEALTPSEAQLQPHSTSVFKAGEWLAELLCLIPLHIAITEENRFVPLKDGVHNPNLEQELLGADISAIISSISLGWYESIIGAYKANKPVKVISSMGEHLALNLLPCIFPY